MDKNSHPLLHIYICGAAKWGVTSTEDPRDYPDAICNFHGVLQWPKPGLLAVEELCIMQVSRLLDKIIIDSGFMKIFALIENMW